MRLNQNPSSDKTDAGVSVVVGFILIIAIAMLGLTIYQQDVVPQNERASEIQHHQLAMNQLQEFQSSFMDSADGGATSTSFQPGLTYGSTGSVFVHSPPSAGRVSVEGFDTPVQITNAEGTGQSSVFWDAEGDHETVGNGENGIVYNTGFFTYEPNYYHFQNAPDTELEYGLLYKDYRSTGVKQQVSMTNQPVVQGQNINLIMMSGDLTASRVSSMNLEVEPVSASSNRISVTNPDQNNQMNISIPTNVPVEKWRTMLSDEACETDGSPLSNGDYNCPNQGSNHGPGHVAEVELQEPAPSGSNERVINIHFERGVTYDLKMSKLFVSTESSSTQKPTTDALYAAWSGSNDITIREESAVSIPSVALDAYNNPVDGARVVSEAVNIRGNNGNYPEDCYGGFSTGSSYVEAETCENGNSAGNFYQRGHEQSGNDGEVIFVYQAPDVENDVRLEFRVCLGEYITEGNNDPDGGNFAECQAVEDNRGADLTQNN